MNTQIKIFITVAVIAGFIFLYIRYLESRGVYYPSKEILFYPSGVNLLFEDVSITSDDGLQINGWFVPSADARYTVIFFHGNAGNISDRLEKIISLNHLNLNIFIIDYRGYGRSQGNPTEKGLYLDSEAAYNYLVRVRHIQPEQIILYGESLGTAVAINLASKRKVLAIILEGAFSNGRDMASTIYHFLPKFIFSNIFDSSTKMKTISAPKLFLHSRTDEIVPFTLSERLYQVSSEPKKFIEIGGSHNTCFFDSRDKVISGISSFIEELSDKT